MFELAAVYIHFSIVFLAIVDALRLALLIYIFQPQNCTTIVHTIGVAEAETQPNKMHPITKKTLNSNKNGHYTLDTIKKRKYSEKRYLWVHVYFRITLVGGTQLWTRKVWPVRTRTNTCAA